jgi:hypothetical protein
VRTQSVPVGQRRADTAASSAKQWKKWLTSLATADILYAQATRITFHRLRRSPLESNGRAAAKKLIVFDLDGTLADSRSPLDPRTAVLTA